MRDRKGYLENNKQRKKGSVKMALDDLWKQQKDEDGSRGEKTGENKEYSSGAKYESSVQFWSSLSRLKTTALDTSDVERCSRSMPFLEDSDCEHKDVRDKEDLSITENGEKMFKCSNKENKKVHADTTSQMVSKQSSHAAKHHISNSQTRKMKFEQIVNEKRKYLLNKYKIKKRNHESTNKELNRSINTSEKINASNKTNKIHIPVQIDREKLKVTSEVKLSEKEVNNSKSSYYRSETMEADSTVSNDNNKNIIQPKDVSQHKLCESVKSDKFRRSSNIPTVPNQNYLSIKERKRKRIKEKFRDCFDKCLTMSEEEEEEAIIDLSMYKRQRNDFNETLNDSTNIESHTVLEVQDTTTNLVSCENIKNNIVYKETSKVKNVKQVEAVSSIMDVIECNNGKTVCDNDIFVLENECPVHKNSHMEEIATSALPNNDEDIQTNLSNELQIKILNYSSENHLLDSKSNAKGKYVEKPSTLQKSIDAERDALPDSNINNDDFNDTSMKVLSNYAIQMKTSNEKSSSNNNFHEITCRVSQNSYIGESQLIADSGDSDTVPKISNSSLNSSTPVKEILETSKNTENQATTLQDNVSIDTTTQKESAMVPNINSTEFHVKNINDHKCTVRNSHMSLQNITDSTLEVYKDCTKNVREDLNQLLQMGINQNHRIQSDGNTITIKEDLEKATSQNVTAKEICINNVTNKENEISSKHSVSKTEVKLTEKRSTTVTDVGLKENINTHNVQNKDDVVIPILSGEEEKLSTNNNTVGNVSPIVSDTSKQHTLPDCNAKDTDNFNQPERMQPIKIRVLSSAELGSRWCPTPANNLTFSSVTEPKLSSHTTTEPVNDNKLCKDSTTNVTLNLDSISPDTKLSLSYIYNIMMRIRTIEKKYLAANCQNMTTDKQKTISDDEQFKSNFTVLLQEFLNLKTELKISDLNNVVQYAIFMINKHLIPPRCEPISGKELAHYMKALNIKSLKSKAASPSTDFSVPNEQSTNLDNAHTATTKPVSNVSNNPNVVPVTISFVPNVYVSTVSQGHIVYNNSPRQNTYVSNVSNQNHEYNISNLQAAQTPSTTVSYVPSMQSTYKNVQVLQENRTPVINVPYHQRIIQQQPIPVIRTNNVPHANIQLKRNIHNAPKVNMHQRPPESVIRNTSEFLTGQSTITQRLQQQSMSHNIQQVSQQAQMSQIYMAQNAQSTQVSCSATLPTHSQIYMSQSVQNTQVSCPTTLPTQSQIYISQNVQNTQVSCPTTLPTQSQIYMSQNAKNTQVSCTTTLPTYSQMYMSQNAKNSQVSCSTTLPTYSQMYMSQNAKSTQVSCSTTLPTYSQMYMSQNAKSTQVSCSTTLPTYSQIYMSQNAKNTQASCSTTLPTRSSKSLPSSNTILHELAFKIWDQLAYCFELKIIDCRLLHNGYGKNYCPLQRFHDKWTQAMTNFIYQRMQSNELTNLQSLKAKRMFYILHEKWRREQIFLKNMEPLNQTTLMDILKNNQIKRRQNLVSPLSSKLPNATMQSEVTQHISGENTKNVELKKQLQSQPLLQLELLNNMIVSTNNVASNPSKKNNSVLAGSDFINSDKTNYLGNINVAAFTTLEGTDEKQKNMSKTDGVSSLERNNIEALEVTDVQKESLSLEQTRQEVVHTREESSLLRQTITEEAVPVQEKNSLPEQTIQEVVHMEKESSLPEQTITEEVVHVQEKNSLPEQTIQEVVHMEKESSLPEQTITEEVVHVQEKNSLPEQTTREEVHMETESSLPEQTIGEDVIHVQEKNALPEQTLREDVHMEIESLLPAQAIGEEVVHGKEHGSLIEQSIKDNTNYSQCDLIQSVTLSDPHIVDVRSISPTSFNKMDNTSALSNFELSFNEDTENTEVKVEIEIPDDKIICLQCSEESTVVCEVCIKAHYCSKECQVLHWSLEHYKDCKPHSLRLSEEDDNDAPMTEDIDFDLNYMNVP